VKGNNLEARVIHKSWSKFSNTVWYHLWIYTVG